MRSMNVPRLLLGVTIAFASVASAQSVFTDRTFEVSGLSLHIRCAGERKPGSPLVVLEAGAGNSADTWRDVHAPIAQFARACAYDRPGRGSSASPAAALAADAYVPLLSDLLKAAGEQGPYVLVGHSIGGVLAALFANRHPSDVAGMVLVDSSHEQQIKRFSALPAPVPPVGAAAPPRPAGMPPPEPLPIPGLIELLSAQPWRGAIPLVVLTRGIPSPPPGDPNPAARNAIWLDLQRDWSTRSPKGRQIVAAKSGHYIHNDEPALVIDAVKSVVEQATPR
jgi:pimeloyl-ACP methyl ester carboxylesterase